MTSSSSFVASAIELAFASSKSSHEDSWTMVVVERELVHHRGSSLLQEAGMVAW